MRENTHTHTHTHTHTCTRYIDAAESEFSFRSIYTGGLSSFSLSLSLSLSLCLSLSLSLSLSLFLAAQWSSIVRARAAVAAAAPVVNLITTPALFFLLKCNTQSACSETKEGERDRARARAAAAMRANAHSRHIANSSGLVAPSRVICTSMTSAAAATVGERVRVCIRLRSGCICLEAFVGRWI